MSKETSKCQAMREERGDFKWFLRGHGIDIGCGDDLLQIKDGTVDPWDLAQGDAMLLEGVPDEKYDFVYSSHALEHMVSVSTALENWARVLKPGGCLYIVVPDYALFEGAEWPSKYNPDHKWSFSFRLTPNEVGRVNHWQVSDLCQDLKMFSGIFPVRVTLEDDGYDYGSSEYGNQTYRNALAQICYTGVKI